VQTPPTRSLRSTWAATILVLGCSSADVQGAPTPFDASGAPAFFDGAADPDREDGRDRDRDGGPEAPDATLAAQADANETEAPSDAAIAATPSPDELWVVRLDRRIGEGTAAVQIRRFALPSGPELLPPIEMPVLPSGRDLAFTLSGAEGSPFRGRATRSLDGRFVTLAGYGIGPGVRWPEQERYGKVPRVVAKIDATRRVETSTTVAAFVGHEVLGSLTIDGSRHWTFGALGIVHHRDGVDEIGTLVYEGSVRALNPFAAGTLASVDVAPPRPSLVDLGERLPLVQVFPRDGFDLRPELGGVDCLREVFFYARKRPTIDTMYVVTCRDPHIHHFEMNAVGRYALVKSIDINDGSVASRQEGSDIVFYVSEGGIVRGIRDPGGPNVDAIRRWQLAGGIYDSSDIFLGLAFAPR
jgi:hypothetical protein